MSEINQPTPIKPIWPTRRDERPQKRPPREKPELEDEESSDQREDNQGQNKDGPIIDDYA